MAPSVPKHLFSAGSNAHGQLSTGTLDDVHTFLPCSFVLESASDHEHSTLSDGKLPPGTVRVVKIACGANHTLLLLDVAIPTPNASDRIERQLWGCGDGRAGQLGPGYLGGLVLRRVELKHTLGTGIDWEEYVIKDIAAAWETSYVVLSSINDTSDVLLSMGADSFGALGTGGATGSSAQKSVQSVVLENLFPDRGKITVEHIVSGPRHTAAHILYAPQNSSSSPTALVIGWGASRHGQLGTFSESAPKDSKLVKPPSFVPSPRVVLRAATSGPDKVSGLAAGDRHTLVLFQSGRVKALGGNTHKQLESLDLWPDVTSVGATWRGSYGVQDDGTVTCVGDNSHGQLACQSLDHALSSTINAGSPGYRFKSFVCGSEHVCTLWESEVGTKTEVQVWGWNEHGNLGLGHTDDVYRPVPISLPPSSDGQRVLGVWAGCGTTWIVTS